MKGEMMTHKQIAKMIKSKGLQKVRWYCQMCQKQCRDANGFKCHLSSESHQRNMSLYASHKGRFTDEFSKEFDAGMMDIIRRKYKSQRVHANVVYNEYIRDREHTRMNATRWVTLTNYVMYLGQSGKCKVEETPKGWYLLYNETDPEVLKKQARLEKKEQMEKDAEARQLAEIEKRYYATHKVESKPTELIRDSDSGKIVFSFNINKKNTSSISESGAEESKQETQFQFEGNPDEYVHYDGEFNAEEMDLPYEFENDEFEQYEVEETEEGNEEDGSKMESDNEMEINTSLKTSESTITTSNNLALQTVVPQVKMELPSAPQTEKPVEIQNSKPIDIPKEIPKPKAEEPKLKQEEKPKPTSSKPASMIGSQWDKEVSSDFKKKEQEKKRKVSALEELMLQEEQKKEKINRKDYWLTTGIVVKVINKKLADGYVKQVIDKFVGVVKMLEGGDTLKLDQEHLETVIPNIGGQVKIVNGAYRGAEGSLVSINTAKFSASVKLLTGPHTGRTIQADYEDISKIYAEM